MWRDYFSVEYAVYNETVVFKALVKYHQNIPAFSVPLGKDFFGSIEKIVDYCRINGLQTVFCPVANEDIKALQEVFSEFRLYKDANWSDYVYRADDLISLPGRKYSGQRNHINYFKRTFMDHTFEEISSDNLEDVRDFYVRLSSRLDLVSDISIEDHVKTLEVLDNYDKYGLLGGLLRVNNTVAAFSIGEVVNDVLFVHIEKADLRYKGAYQIICNAFARRFASDGVGFINREEDVGDEGLRFSKKSYHPYEIIDKYIFFVL